MTTQQGLAAVTGVTGCVGRAVSDALLAAGWAVRGLVRRPADITPKYSEHTGDLADPSSLAGLCTDAQLVVHTAANLSDWGARREIWQVNRDGTRAVLDEAVRGGATRFLYLSTVDVFGFDGRKILSERSPKQCPHYAYSMSKLAGENLAWAYQRNGLEVTVIYPAWVFGPGDRHLIPELIKGLQNRELVHIDRGHAPLELTYSENLAQAIVLAAADSACAGERFIVGDSYDLTFGQLIDLIAEQLGVLPPRHSVPYPVAWTAAALSELVAALRRKKERPMLTRYAVASVAGGMRYDLSRIRSIGYNPEIDAMTALRRTLDAVLTDHSN
jgi:2-alkyl-3-oxoalkanoate reductase